MNRRRELALLTDTFERVKVRERAHLVTLLGEPGIGKTRVVEEFLGGLLDDDVKVLAGPLQPVRGRGHVLAAGPDGLPRDRRRTRTRPTTRSPTGSERSSRNGSSPTTSTRRPGGSRWRWASTTMTAEEGRYHAAEVRRGLLSLLTGLASRGPVVLVFEDLHEADPLLLDLIEQLVKEARRVPLMVLCVARWEFLEERPNWAGGIADAVTLWVEPLTIGHAAELAMEAGDLRRATTPNAWPSTPAATRSSSWRSWACCAGRSEICPRAGPPPSARLLPPTVQAVIAARIDQLSPAARVAGAARVGLPAGAVRPGRALADRRAAQGAAGRGRGRRSC